MSTPEFVIEKGVPPPKLRSPYLALKATVSQFAAGDSVLVADKATARTIYVALIRHWGAGNITMRKQPDGTRRIWRLK